MAETPKRGLQRRNLIRLLGGVAIAASGGRRAFAAWPERPITIIVHFAPGGSNDLLGRLIAAELGPRLGQNVLVENRPGANGNIGVAAAARAAPDGYTLAVVSGSALVNPALMKVNYDLQRDFVPIAYLGASPSVILTGPESGIGTLADLIAKAKASPGRLTYGTPGAGSTPHLTMELLQVRAGIKLTHVPYSGAAPAITAVMGGTTDLACANISGIVGNIKAGNVRALAETGTERWPELPDVPTMAQAGVHNAEAQTSQFLLARTGTPQQIVDRLASLTLEIMQRPEIKERMLNAGFAVAPEAPEATRARIADELTLWATIAHEAGLARR